MAKAFVESTNFCFNVSNVSALKTITSPEINVRGIPWAVEVCKKKDDGGNESLAVYLYCGKKGRPSYAYAAHALFTLRPFGEGPSAIDYCDPTIFDNSGIGYGADSLISWRDLFDAEKGYVKNDTIKLDIQIEVADPKNAEKSNLICAIVEKCCEEGCSAKFRLTVTKIDNLVAVRTNVLSLRKIGWFLTVYKNRMGRLGIRLQNLRSAKNCSCNARMSIRLMSSNGAQNIERVKIANMKRFGDLDVANIVSWDELLNPENGYAANGSIVIEVELNLTDREGLGHKNCRNKGAKNNEKRLTIECAICFESIANKEVSSVPCGHIFCTVCITKAIEAQNVCPMCGVQARLEDLRRTQLNM